MRMPISLFVLATLMTFSLPGIVGAFHEGGVNFCEGCHVIHKSPSGQIQDRNDSTIPMDLKGLDASSTCLRCHAQSGKFYNVLSNDGSTYSAGGDFYWLKKTFTWSANDKFYQSSGDNHGHNVVAAEYGLHQESMLNSAPGGIYSPSALGCTSCHDPHSRTVKDGYTGEIPVSDSYGEDLGIKITVGNYRLLGGIGYNGGAQAGGVTFNHPAPVAVADAQNWVETNSNHTAYGSGMSEWCNNCHSDFLTGNGKHPVGNDATLSSTFISNYNSYVKTGDITGTQATAYLALLPFESGTADKWSLDPSSTSGPAQGANLMCLTCHRAHASSFKDIGRWDFGTTFVADSHPRPGDGGATGNDMRNSYYGRDMVAEFGLYQRRLCNKCHLLD
ncbi:MAG: cytochrome C [Desulfobacteraceae bacterium]|nr:cytochrome C [Desulfobacteraceae bacterium]